MDIYTEAQLRQALERQSAIIDNVPAMIAYWDRDQRCRFANKIYFEWFGFTPESLYGMSLKELLGEDLYKKNEIYILGALAGQHQQFERDLKRKKQGDLRHTQASYIPDIVDGIVKGFFVLVADITERKRAEFEAIKAKEAALAAYKVKSRFLANISHEIRTPMNGVLGMLSLALHGPISAEQREFLEAANDSAEHLLSIINDILDLSKLEAGELALSNYEFSLRETIFSALAAVQIQAQQKGLGTRVLIGDELTEKFLGDAGRLKQVLMNIFGNAVKFTLEGSVEMSVHMQSDELIHFEISDTGIGIPQDKLESIFLPFRQVDESTTRQFGGTGLGLAICKDLVQMMGGQIQVQSELGKGSIFRFTVRMTPVVKTEMRFKDKLNVTAAPLVGNPEPRLLVLMAEDDAICMRIQSQMLRAQNCEVFCAFNGKEAVELAGQQTFDLIFLDMHMPIFDGVETAKKIRADKNCASRSVQIVAITANNLSEDKAACLAAGMNQFLSKPVKMEQLALLIQEFRRGIFSQSMGPH